MPEKTNLTVYGLISSIHFIKAKNFLQDLFDAHADVLQPPTIVPLFEFDWMEFLIAKRKEFRQRLMELRGEVWTYSEPVMVFVNKNLIGGIPELLAWANDNFDDFCDFRPDALCETLSKELYVSTINRSGHIFVYLDVAKDEEKLGRLVIELYNDIVPNAAENFRCLCTGEMGQSKTTPYALRYRNTLIHRIVPNGWIQAGDIHDGRGNGGESIYGPVFDDECFAIKHDRSGIVGFANKGPHTNQSQFYITLQPASWMDAKYEAIGRIVEGYDTLEAIKGVETMNERPTGVVTIADCGQLFFQF